MVELENTEGDFLNKTVTMPCNLRSVLERDAEYIIIDSDPEIPGIQDIDPWELNDILESINDENPEMTADFFTILANAAKVMDLADDEFVRRVKENDFLFHDLSDIDWHMSSEEIAGCYVATVLKIPFDTGINKEMLEMLAEDSICDYIDWNKIWSQYEIIGFSIEETYDEENNYKLYLVHWRE